MNDDRTTNVRQASVFFLSLLVLRLALDYSYVEFVHVTFGEHFLAMRLKVDGLQYLLSLTVFAAFCLTLRSYQHSVGNIFQVMAAIFLVAPLTSQYGLDAEKPLEPVLATVGAMIAVRVFAEIRLLDRQNYTTVRHGKLAIAAVAILGVTYLIAWSYVSGAAANFSLNPETVYEVRAQTSDVLDVGMLAYVNLWVYKFFTIFLVCLCLEKRAYLLLVLVLIVQTYFAAVTQFKIVFFLPFLAIGFWYFLTRVRSLYPLPLATAALVLTSIAIYFIWDLDIVPAMLIRRAFYVPSGATFEWFNYFATHPHVYWSDSLFSSVLSSEYSGSRIPFVIGDYLNYGHDLNANNGLVSAGYAHASYFGILIYALILGGVLNLLNHLSATGVPMWMTVVLTIGPLRTAIADADLPTALLSHGIFLALLFLFLCRTRKVTSKSANRVQGGVRVAEPVAAT